MLHVCITEIQGSMYLHIGIYVCIAGSKGAVHITIDDTQQHY